MLDFMPASSHRPCTSLERQQFHPRFCRSMGLQTECNFRSVAPPSGCPDTLRCPATPWPPARASMCRWPLPRLWPMPRQRWSKPAAGKFLVILSWHVVPAVRGNQLASSRIVSHGAALIERKRVATVFVCDWSRSAVWAGCYARHQRASI